MSLYWICILSVLMWISCITEGSIFSSKLHNDKNEWIDLNSERGLPIRRSLFRSRHRRSSVIGPRVHRFDLTNATTHNQALIHWSGENSSVVFILTRKKSGSSTNMITESTLWRSSDYGKTYKVMTDQFPKNAVLKSYFVCPTDKMKVIFVDTYDNSRRIWVSENEGETYVNITVPFSVEKLEFHPEKSRWLLGYDKLLRQLHCSMDFGTTWTTLGSEVTSERYFWYVKDVDKGPNADRIVHFEYRQLFTSVINRIYKMRSCYIPDCRDTDFQGVFDKIENIDMDSLVVQDSYVFVQKSGAANKLYVSYNRGDFVKATFPPYEGKAQSHFHVVSSDGECVVVGVNHDNGLTHLFFSDLKGQKYRQSLSNVRYYNRKTSDNKVYTVDVHEVQGIVGTYIANVHASDGYSAGLNTTRISWNNGQSWSNITDVKGLSSLCKNCQLNLHLSMDQTKSGYYMPAIISKKSVPGLIIAHGTFGKTVDDNPNHVILFVSNDNGRSWSYARTQRHLVVVANHGAIIVAIRMIFLKAVNTLDFSSDYGVNWNTFEFENKDEAVNVDGILTEPGETTHYLTLFGHKTYADSWRIFQLDMSPLLPKPCTYPTDFENITFPTQIGSGRCHLGLIQTSERLKEGQKCLIPSNYKRIATKTVCNCTMRDYECDLGYEPAALPKGHFACKRQRYGPIDDVGDDIFPNFVPSVPCDASNHRNVSSGFRKIPGDKCQHEVPNVYWKIEQCTPQTTTPATTTTNPLANNVQIQLVNKTSNAKIGENLVFSIRGGAGDAVIWHVLRPNPLSKPKELVKKPGNFTLLPEEPGKYRVQLSLKNNNKFSNMILVEFWYPIEKVYLYHPPVVAQKKPYNATAWTQTKYGLRGNRTLLGDVSYIWNVRAEQPIYSKTNELVDIMHSEALGSVKISVTAENTVSLQSTSGKIHVKEYVETLVLEMECSPAMDSSRMNDLWLQEFRQALNMKLYNTKKFAEVASKHQLHNDVNLFIYVPPSDKLRVYIYVTPMKDDKKEDLLEAAKSMEAAIAEAEIAVLLSQHHTVTVRKQYIIDHDGTIIFYTPPAAATSSKGGVIAVVVILVILIIVVGFFVIRRVATRMHFDRYFPCPNFRSRSRGSSHIVRNQDRNHILAEEYIDDDLDTMEGIGSQGATLQFQG